MDSKTLRAKYISFFRDKGHIEIPSSSLVPENDPTTLFTSAGMQPLIPYLLGTPHPQGKRLVNSQRCFRASDIAAVGDNRHTTFFEMLGNWSLGDYFKKEQLSWLWQFLTQEIALDKDKLYISVFAGSSSIPQDRETASSWKSLGVAKDHIYSYGVDQNWWSRAGTPDQMPEGEIGGPDSEVFYDFATPHNLKFGDICHPNCQCGRFLEIGNSVFIQYKKTSDGKLAELPQKNVDFGGGLERLLAAVNNQPDIFKTDLFTLIISGIVHHIDKAESLKVRVIADHIKAATFLINDGVIPSNKLQGYVLRRLLRRAAVKMRQLNNSVYIPGAFLSIAYSVLDTYEIAAKDETHIETIIEEEMQRFEKTLEKGLREIEKINKIDGNTAFNLYQSYGFPFEILEELFAQKGQTINRAEFDEEFKKHQEISKATV